MPYGIQFADEPVDADIDVNAMGTKPNGTYRKDTDDWDA